MRSAASAAATCMAPASASEKTAMLRRPRRRQVAAMRQAISPRLAIRTGPSTSGVQHDDDLALLDLVALGDQDLADGRVARRLHRDLHLHGFEDEQDVA